MVERYVPNVAETIMNTIKDKLLDMEIEELEWLSKEAFEDDVDIIKEDAADMIRLMREEMNDTIADLKKEYATELKSDIEALKASRRIE